MKLISFITWFQGYNVTNQFYYLFSGLCVTNHIDFVIELK